MGTGIGDEGAAGVVAGVVTGVVAGVVTPLLMLLGK